MVAATLKERVTGGFRRYWWLFLIRGWFGLALGVYAIAFPGATLAVVVILLGAYLIVDGVTAVIKGFQAMRLDTHWWRCCSKVSWASRSDSRSSRGPDFRSSPSRIWWGYWAIVTGVIAIFLG